SQLLTLRRYINATSQLARSLAGNGRLRGLRRVRRGVGRLRLLRVGRDVRLGRLGLVRTSLVRGRRGRVHRHLVGAAILEQHRTFRGILLAQAGAGTSNRRASNRVSRVTDRGRVPEVAAIAVPTPVVVMMPEVVVVPNVAAVMAANVT